MLGERHRFINIIIYFLSSESNSFAVALNFYEMQVIISSASPLPVWTAVSLGLSAPSCPHPKLMLQLIIWLWHHSSSTENSVLGILQVSEGETWELPTC